MSEFIEQSEGMEPDQYAQSILGDYACKFKEEAKYRVASGLVAGALESGAVTHEEIVEFAQGRLAEGFDWSGTA